MAFWTALCSRPTKRVVGLMSGTSADGVDAALVELHGYGRATRVRVLAHATYPYPEPLRQQILAACEPATGHVELLCHLNFALGHCFAEAALALIARAGLTPAEVDLIGSHGQTVYHLPQATPTRLPSTLQLGEPCVIAERTGITTVADFRPRDMAAGGLGAPLAPYGHALLFADPSRPKAVQNIGGMANVTVLAEGTVPLAFDTGPGNVLIDEAVRHFSGGTRHYDANGALAAQGTVHEGLLAELLQHPFLQQPPPKATGRETFGPALWREVLARSQALGLAPADVVRTCTAFTVEAIYANYRRFIFPRWPIAEVVVCGGGAANPVLMQLLRQRLQPLLVTTPEDYGYPNEALEAILFAILANETIHGQAANVPCATGARRAVVLGKIVPPR
ncbi:MAG: anhydro-N-acetylmuramic acid kinase [Candidatus Tectimicrobiota bacterium]|nr:MAG: anhydro-N-acetylmuramic acid kinase [Candidatus Tectomicrobia bacterium]